MISSILFFPLKNKRSFNLIVSFSSSLVSINDNKQRRLWLSYEINYSQKRKIKIISMYSFSQENKIWKKEIFNFTFLPLVITIVDKRDLSLGFNNRLFAFYRLKDGCFSNGGVWERWTVSRVQTCCKTLHGLCELEHTGVFQLTNHCSISHTLVRPASKSGNFP